MTLRNPDHPDGSANQGRIRIDDSRYEPVFMSGEDLLYALTLVALMMCFSIVVAALFDIGWTDVIQWLALVGRAVTWSAT